MVALATNLKAQNLREIALLKETALNTHTELQVGGTRIYPSTTRVYRSNMRALFTLRKLIKYVFRLYNIYLKAKLTTTCLFLF